MVENAKIQIFKCDILGDFQIMCSKFYNFLVDFKTTFAILHFFKRFFSL